MTNLELRSIIQNALYNEYGFAPNKKEITLLEANDDGTYILFRIGKKEYRFNSFEIGGLGVWAGEGTIDRKIEIIV